MSEHIICLAKPALPQRGSSLIEVLISLLLVTTGVLGLVSLQSNSMTSNREAYYRTQATVMAYDIIDRMRANKPQAQAGNYISALADHVTGTACTATCDTTQLKDADLILWKAELAEQLPGGQGAISRIGAADANTYNVRVQWQNLNDEAFNLDVGVKM